MTELRQSGLQLQRWVVFSAARSGRPHDISEKNASKTSNTCPFCRGHEHETGDETFVFRESDVVGAPDWSVRVVYNKFPALETRNAGGFVAEEVDGGVCRRGPGFGSHEVVVETPEHGVPFAELPLGHVEKVVRAFRHRLKALRDDKRFKYVQIFKNNGKEAGASLRHSHSQIIALPLVPDEISFQVSNCKDYFEKHKSCILCDSLRADERDGSRLVARSSNFVALAPFAARFPYETWIVPVKHSSNFEESDDSELEDLAKLLQLTIKKVVQHLQDAPYNYMLYNNPFDEDASSSSFHWYISVVPRQGVLGGFELATGCNINTVQPERAAQLLRDCNVIL